MSAGSIWVSTSSAAASRRGVGAGFSAGERGWRPPGPPRRRRAAPPADVLAMDFVVVPDRAQLSEIVRRARDGRVRTNIANVATLDNAVAALNPTERVKGKPIIRVRP